MKKKICTSCGKTKALVNFSDDKRHSSGKQSQCKECKRLYAINDRKTEKEKYKKQRRLRKQKSPWKFVLMAIKDRCNNENHKLYSRYGKRNIKCLISQEDLKYLWFRDKAYLMKQPSIDRIDNDGHYELNNCQFIELDENRMKDRFKAILQFDLNGNFIKEWNSSKEASEELKIGASNISQCLTKKYKTAGNYKWDYKLIKSKEVNENI